MGEAFTTPVRPSGCQLLHPFLPAQDLLQRSPHRVPPEPSQVRNTTLTTHRTILAPSSLKSQVHNSATTGVPPSTPQIHRKVPSVPGLSGNPSTALPCPFDLYSFAKHYFRKTKNPMQRTTASSPTQANVALQGCISGLGWRLTTSQREPETHSPGTARNSSHPCSNLQQSYGALQSQWHRLDETRRFQQAPFFGDISSVSRRGSNLFPPPLCLRTEATQGTAYVVLQQSHRL